MAAAKNVNQAAQTLMEEGNEFIKASNFDGAIEKYNEAIKLHPDPLSFCNRAAAYIHLQQYDLAIQDCQSALEMDDKCAKAYGKMGLAYYYQNRYDASLEAHETALALDPFYMLNDGYENQMDTIQQKLTEAKNYCSTIFGGNGEIADFSDFMNNEYIMGAAVEMMKDPAIQKNLESMMEQFMGGAAGTNGTNFHDLMTAGQNMTQQMQHANVQLLVTLREQLAAGVAIEEQNDNDASSNENTSESYESLN